MRVVLGLEQSEYGHTDIRPTKRAFKNKLNCKRPNPITPKSSRTKEHLLDRSHTTDYARFQNGRQLWCRLLRCRRLGTTSYVTEPMGHLTNMALPWYRRLTRGGHRRYGQSTFATSVRIVSLCISPNAQKGGPWVFHNHRGGGG